MCVVFNHFGFVGSYVLHLSNRPTGNIKLYGSKYSITNAFPLHLYDVRVRGVKRAEGAKANPHNRHTLCTTYSLYGCVSVMNPLIRFKIYESRYVRFLKLLPCTRHNLRCSPLYRYYNSYIFDTHAHAHT